MLGLQVRRLMDAYPVIFLACHRRHVRDDETGKSVSENQAGILDHLDVTRPTTLSKLAEHLGVSRSTMSITVERLVKAGFIRRTRGKTDRRCVALTLTTAGARIKEHNTILDPELVEEMFSRMRDPELENALRGIECLAKHAGIVLRQRSRERKR